MLDSGLRRIDAGNAIQMRLPCFMTVIVHV